VVTLVGQRVFGIALGHEDLNDHDELRHDPMMAVLAGKLEARREDCAPVAGKSTLNRLELSRLEPTRYHKISHNPVAIKRLLVDLFVEAHARRRSRSSLISMRLTIRCTASRRGGSSTAITTVTAICRFTCSAGGICWPPSCDPPTWMARRRPPDERRPAQRQRTFRLGAGRKKQIELLLVHAGMMGRPIGLSNAGHRGRPLFQTKNLPADQNGPTKKMRGLRGLDRYSREARTRRPTGWRVRRIPALQNRRTTWRTTHALRRRTDDPLPTHGHTSPWPLTPAQELL
jgi:Transposase DDE domain group 1